VSTPSTLYVGATVFDGTGRPGQRADLWVRDGRVEAVGRGLRVPENTVVEDVSGCWITPGFVDIHTHYDAELELAPELSESLRHGVTTVLVGSCGLSMAAGRPVDLADMFCRVEGIPRSVVLPLLEERLDWSGPAEYFEHLDGLALGPNVCALLGHSTIRAVAMGIDRALDETVRPTEDELQRMEALLDEALHAGYLGLSINTLPWDKMDGQAHRSKPTPSVFGTWSEYRRLMRPLRSWGRVLQGVPNLATKVNILLFLAASTGLLRRGLKTSLLALMDPKADRAAPWLAGWAARLVNAVLGADVRFQALPNPFDIYTDGLENPVIEEFGAGTAALHIEDPQQRAALLRDPDFRRRFRKDWAGAILGKAYHRDLYEARIVSCPEPGLAGRTFGEVADQRGMEPIELFLDLQADHGQELRWYSVVANDRPHRLRWILERPDILVGFSDAGAHLRNMAYYNFPLRFLWRAHEAEQSGEDFPSVARAVHRCTAEIADWMGIDAGTLAPGRRADLVVLDPNELDRRVEDVHEAPTPGFAGLQRLVRRTPGLVRQVVVGGRTAWVDGAPAPGLGTERFGRLLRAQ
jgi:N-acyl-D-aspartate/D-glutamate deacylase